MMKHDYKRAVRSVLICCTALLVLIFGLAAVVAAQTDDDGVPPLATEEAITPPERVEVDPTAEDPEIAERLETILIATKWFEDPTVSVRDGVVFLTGSTTREQYRTWAGDLSAQYARRGGCCQQRHGG